MSFSGAAHAWREKTDKKLETAQRKIALSAFGEVVFMSPVDTGRFRGNWQVAIGETIGRLPPKLEDFPADVMPEVESMVAQLKAGETIWLVNNLPYAVRLEHGWSDQAPGGMVRLTAQRWQPIVEQIAKELAGD